VGFLIWLQATDFADWVRSSSIGYPMMITFHAIGMGVMVGLALILDARLLGWFLAIPYSALQRFLGVAWLGFGINFLSGSALFTTQAPDYVVHVIFMVKMGFVVLGAITAAILQNMVGRDSASWGEGAAPRSAQIVAVLSMIFWVTAIVTGRLTAYV
jgi:hypothetical protein